MQDRQAKGSRLSWQQPVWLSAVASALDVATVRTQQPTTSASVEPQIAFYYGRDVPVAELQAFGWVMLKPATAGSFDPKQPSPTLWFARVNLMQQTNTICTSAQPASVIDQVFAPLPAQGYVGFLLDGLDAFQRGAPDVTDAVAALVQALHARVPQTRLLAGGMAWLGMLALQLSDVVTAGLVRERTGGEDLQEMTDADHATRVATLRKIGAQYRIPTVALDYYPNYNRTCLRETANMARAAGITSYATTPGADFIGIGWLEVMPRRVLLVEPQEPGTNRNTAPSVLYLTMPINYLGYRTEFADANKPLPTVTPDRYAGVVTWFDGNASRPGTWSSWFRRTMGTGVRVAMFNQLGLNMDATTARVLDLQTVPGTSAGPLDIVSRDPMVGLEL